MSLIWYKFSRADRSAATEASFKHLEALTLAASHSVAKYSDYSDEQVVQAFASATDIIFPAEVASPLFVVPLAVVLMQRNTITLTFTLPAGKGRKIVINLIEEAVKYIQSKEEGYDCVLCQTHGFDWISSSAAYNKFERLSNSTGIRDDDKIYKTYILRFNVDKLIEHDKVEALAVATTEQIKQEELIENANYDYVKSHTGYLLKSLLDSSLERGTLTEEELARARFDVRVSLLRPGQSQSPLGTHTDFLSVDAVARLKILFVTNGYSETRLYTTPCMTTMAGSLTKDWFRVMRQPEIQAAITGSADSTGPADDKIEKPYITAKPFHPIIFTDRTLHEATVLTKEQMPVGCEAVWRYFIRIIVYPEDRLNEVPKGGSVGVPFTYLLSSQEM